VTGTHELGAAHVSVGEIVIEMWTPPRRAAHPAVVTAPDDVVLAIDIDRLHRALLDGTRRKLHQRRARIN
jgi:hypothetical protein